MDGPMTPVEVVGRLTTMLPWLPEGVQRDLTWLLEQVKDLSVLERVHLCTPGCSDGCDIRKTRQVIGPVVVTERGPWLTEEAIEDVRKMLFPNLED